MQMLFPTLENAGQVGYNSTITAKAQNSSSAVTANGTSNYKLAGFSSAADKATESTIGGNKLSIHLRVCCIVK